MAKQIVTKAEGEVYRLDADGGKIKLQTGDIVEAGTRIITETGASVRFEDENGIPMELGENSGAVLFSDVLIEPGDTLFAMDTEAAEESAAEGPQDGEELPLPSDSESKSDTVSEMHSFVNMTRTEYGGDINLSYARDVNVTREIEGRASLNPRIEYDYNVSIIQEVKSYEDPRFPFDGGGRGGEESRFEPVRPAADTIPMPETTGTAAMTDEDVPVVIDPLENFVIPSGLQLTVTGASAQYGTVQIIDGKIAYQPNADYHGGDKITVTVTDQAGRTYESEVDVTVSPVDDTVDDSDSVTEHSSVDTDVLANDKFADLPGAKVTDVTQGQYGEVTINEDGTVKYTPKTDWLAEGEKLTDTYQYTVTTAAGNTETATVTITITGTNDAPLLTDDVRYVTEDAPDTNTGLPHGSSFDNDDTSKVTGNILANDSDPDQTDTLAVTKIEFSDGTTTTVNAGETIAGKYGSLTVNSDGTYTYTLNDGTNGDKNNNVQQLMADEKATDEFTVSVTDGHNIKTETVTIHITGTNDAPVITMEAGDSDGHDFTGGDTLSQDGTLTVADIDVKDTVGTEKMDSLTVSGNYTENSLPGGLTVDDLKDMLTIENGSIDGSSTDGKIDWHFDAGGDGKFDFLADGEKLTLTYKVKSTDGSGAEATHDIKITITGTNDAPVISLGDGDSADGGVRETDSGSLTASNTMTVTDADISDTVSTTVTGVKVSGSGDIAGHIPDEQELLGMFTAETSGLTDTTTEGKINWAFNTGDKTFDYLAVDEEVKLTYTIEVKDSSGATVTKDIVVTVTGSNDSPVISVGNGDSYSISFDDENDANIADGSVGGTLTLTDVDVSDKVGVTVDKVEIDGSYTYNGDLPAGLQEALKNMLSVTTEDILSNTETSKQFNWKFNAGANDKFDFLADGETLTLKYTVKADDKNNIAGNTSDPYNEMSTDTHEITVTITGTNDAPTLNTTAEVKYDVIEDVTTEATKDANIITGRVTDADAHDILSVTEVNGTEVTANDTEITGTYGKLVISPDGKYHYVLDNDDNDTQALQKGQSAEDKFIVRVEDGHGGYVDQTITVNVAGRNDSPDIRVVEGKDLAEGAFAEGELLQSTGTLTLTDADTADKVSAAISGIQVGGTYNLSQLQAAGFLKDPSKLLEMLRIKNTGSPDSDFASRDEIITGTETGSDGNITWKFDAGGEKFAFLNEGETLTLTYTIKADDGQKVETDADGNYISTDTQTVTITITGTNSAPILTNDTNSVTEDNGQLDDSRPEVTTTTGDLFKNDSDPDFNGKGNWKITAKESTSGSDTAVSADGTEIVGKYGKLHLNPNGTYTYTLDNSSDKIQQLGHDGKLEEIFTVTVKDGDLPEKTQNLTITINGTNDAPKITKIVGTDENEAPIYELDIVPSASTPEASGTLTLSDVDLGDKVTVAKLGIDDANFKIEGEQAGLISTRKELYDMLSLSNVDFTTSDGTHSHQFTWTFESGDERFNYLHNNETLILKYRVQATDDSGAGNKTSNDEWITITIKGSNQDGNPAPDTGIVEENDTLTMTETSHSGAINQSNQNLLYNDDSDGHITSFKIGDDGASHNVPATGVNDGWVDVKIGEELIGKIKIEANGNYSFKALNNFSGEVPPITYTNSYGNTGTLQITVTPVADEPTWKEQNDPTKPTPSGDEDTKINLNLKLPEITDNVDLNGNAPGDHPERLGYITISNIQDANIYKADGTLLNKSTNGEIKIVIVGNDVKLDMGLHYTDLGLSGANVVQLTRGEFEKLQIQQEANSGENIVIKLGATSYETDDNGFPLKDANDKFISDGSETDVIVDVKAVTDATPDLKFGSDDTVTKTAIDNAIKDDGLTLTDSDGNKVTDGVTSGGDDANPTIVMDEDSGTLNISNTLLTDTGSAADTDDSETYTVTISGLAEGTVVNSVTASDGKVILDSQEIDSSDLSSFMESLKITPPKDFNGDMTITVTAEAVDSDDDSPEAEPKANSDGLSFTLHVTPVADGLETITVSQAKIYEDTFGGEYNADGELINKETALDIRPILNAGNESATITVEDIPVGSTIKYNGVEYKMTGDTFSPDTGVKITAVRDGEGKITSYSITMEDFQEGKFFIKIKPPLDSNEDFDLKVSGFTTDGDDISSSISDIILHVDVVGVADNVEVITSPKYEGVSYTEAQAENGEISISSLYTKNDDHYDNSESVTIKITGLQDGFSVKGDNVRFLGGEGESREWLVTNPTDGDIITTPKNFSGDIVFKAQAVSTENDGNSYKSELTDVTINVTPTPEATITSSVFADEDTLTKMDFDIVHQNGDNDETLDYVLIKASDIEDGSFTLYYKGAGEDTALQDAADKVDGITTTTVNDDTYYKLEGGAINSIHIKGGANWSGDGSIEVRYGVTDSHYGDTVTSIDGVTKEFNLDGGYSVTVKPVSDTSSLDNLANVDFKDSSATITDSNSDGIYTATFNVTWNGNKESVTIGTHVNTPTDGVNGADRDGSEQLVRIEINGVPDGVKVEGATYMGDAEGGTEGGLWIINYSDKFTSVDEILKDIKFTIDPGNIKLLHQSGDEIPITIKAVTQDTLEHGSGETIYGEEVDSSTTITWNLQVNFEGGPGVTPDIGAPYLQLTEGQGTIEDSLTTMNNLFSVKFTEDADHNVESSGEYRFEITVGGLPEGTEINGTVITGGSYTISGYADNDTINDVLKQILVKLPDNYNDNNDNNGGDGLGLSLSWHTYGWDMNGDGKTPDRNSDSPEQLNPTVTPVTDPMEITVSAVDNIDTMPENQGGKDGTLTFKVDIGSGNDGKFGEVVGNKLYLKVDGAASGDKIYLQNADGSSSELTAEGGYYVISGVNGGDSLTFKYQPAEYSSGKITVTASLTSQEQGAANPESASGSLDLIVESQNSGYELTVKDSSGSEDAIFELDIEKSGLIDTDGSEKAYSAIIKGFSDTEKFIVLYDDSDDPSKAVIASKIFDEATESYVWSVDVKADGTLPHIFIQSLDNYSSVEHLTLTVISGESDKFPITNPVFDEFVVTVKPVADGISDFNPTRSIGTEGEAVSLNINGTVVDTDGSETVNIAVKGLGDGVSFYEDGALIDGARISYDETSNSYVMTGIKYENLGKITFVGASGTGKAEITVSTTDVLLDKDGNILAEDISKGEPPKEIDFIIDAAAPGDKDDTIIYRGEGSYDGLEGRDTLYMANFRDSANSGKNNIDFKSAVDIKNIEIIDMSDGDHTLANLTAEAVKNMTDGNNKLLIRGDAGDKIALSKGWEGGNIVDGYRVYTNDGATIKVAGDVNVTISNGIDTASLMMAMAFAPISNEAAVMPDSITDYGDSSMYDGIHGSAPLSIGTEGTLDFSAVSGSMLDSIDMTNDTAQSLFNVDPFGVYNVTGGSHELTITGTHIDDVSVADASDVPWGAPELSADGSHYTYTATGDFDHNAATPDETVTLNVAREIYDNTLAYDAHALNDGGLGDDTLTFAHEDSVIDFSDGAASQIANIERFDLGDGDHSLANITAKDVFDMTDGRNTLTINGDNADHVSLSDVLNDSSDGMWEASPFHSVENGVGYNVYTGSFEGHTVILKVEEDIIQQLTGISKA